MSEIARKFEVEDGEGTDICPLCGIYRTHAGYLQETCGDGFCQPGCFVIDDEKGGEQHG